MAHFTDSLIEEFELKEANLNYNAELEKIRKWHTTGNRNVAAMSDEKLKMNYDICQTYGYSHEAALLKHEGWVRHLKWALFVPLDTVKLGSEDFMLPDFNFVRASINDPNVIISAYSDSGNPIRTGIILIILTILAGHPEIGEKLKDAMIADYNVSSASIKDAIEKALADATIVDKLDKLSYSNYVDIGESLALNEKVEKHDILNPKL